MKRRLFAVLCVVVAVGRAWALGSADYVRDGLVAQWDGIDNALADGVRCHDATAVWWTDLSGHGLDWKLKPEGCVWTDAGLTMLGTQACATLLQTTAQAFGGKLTTAEFVYANDEKRGGIIFCPGYGGSACLLTTSDGHVGFRGLKSSADRFGVAVEVGATNSFSVTYDRADDAASPTGVKSFYVNGELGVNAGMSSYWDANLASPILGARTKGDVCCKGTLSALRVYSRKLTEAERMQNSVIDALRFGGLPPAGVIVAQTHGEIFSATGFEPGLGFSSGGSHLCTAPTGEQETADGRVRYTVTGWVLRRVAADGRETTTSGGGTSCSVDVPEGGTALIEWQLEPTYRVTATAGEGGAVAPAELWVPEGGTAEVTATPADGKAFSTWSGDCPQMATANPLTVAVTAPVSVEAAFGDLITGVPTDGLAAAVEAAPSNSVIELSAGTYPLSATLSLAKHVVLRGATGDPADVILDARNSVARALAISDANACVEGVTIERAKGSDKTSGPGAYVTAGTLRNCIVRNCAMGSRSSGTVTVAGDLAQVVDCVITNNLLDGADVTAGGAVVLSKGLVDGCYIGYNHLNRTGANIIKATYAPVTVTAGTLRNCVVHHNWSVNLGGISLTVTESSSSASLLAVQVENCIVWNNRVAGDVSTDFRDVWSGAASRCRDCRARATVHEHITTIDALPPLPRFGLGMSIGEGIVPHEVTFTAEPGASSYVWTFGDGTPDETTSEPTCTHVYATAGVFTPRATADGRPLRAAEEVHAFARPTSVVTAGELSETLKYAVDGMTVRLPGGTLTPIETWCVFNAVDVCGAGTTGAGATLVDGNGKTQRAFYVGHPKALVHDLVFQRFSAPNKGSGVTAYVAIGTVSNCVVRSCTHNTTQGSVTMTVSGEDALVTHCVFTNNTASKASGGAPLAIAVGTGGRLENSLIAFNDGKKLDRTSTVQVTGGTVANCTIVDNTNVRYAGVSISDGEVVNCVFAGNSSYAAAEDNDVTSGMTNLLVSCASVGETPFNASCFAGSVDLLFANYAAHDYLPAEGSPLIDHGAALPSYPASDLAGNARVQGKTVDIGCYEAPPAVRSVTPVAVKADGFDGDVVTFTAVLAGFDDETGLVYDWDFDSDGTWDVVGSGATATTTYRDFGAKTVTVAVRDGDEVLAAKTREQTFTVHPRTVYVVGKATNPTEPFATWETAASTFAQAYATAVDGMTIVLSNGTHQLSGEIDLDLAVTVCGVTGDPADVTLTGTGGYVVYLQNRAALVRDVTLDGGSSRGCFWTYPAGGTVSNCVLKAGVSRAYEDDYGAGYLANTNARLTHCRITNCRRTKEGGRTHACVLRNHGFVDNCLFDHNSSVTGSAETMGVIHNAGEIRNCTIVTNTGIAARFLYNAAGARVVNSILSDNVTGGTLASHVLGAGVITNTLIDASSETLFADPAADDWHLQRFCPAVDWVKVDAAAFAGATDLDGRPRLLGRKLDLGCYESLPVPGLMLMIR